ncbi:hypothetical protein CTI12_AA603690 [Artemisia annua]|uniref:Uncharacterized protein n=1 Tax=Artemisia annua TaxID=35608 RepID=A0A2U1KH63_ARTAN|nr:hypothetical protein CTI12_AA603690 [Artemisia annua]
MASSLFVKRLLLANFSTDPRPSRSVQPLHLIAADLWQTRPMVNCMDGYFGAIGLVILQYLLPHTQSRTIETGKEGEKVSLNILGKVKKKVTDEGLRVSIEMELDNWDDYNDRH